MHEYLNSHQKKCVEALRVVSGICLKNNINFFLIEGSALGAIRHNGFIPWDDDIDIGLKYEDWIKLRKLLGDDTRLREMGFRYKDRNSDRCYPRLQPKIIFNGRNCIDIFLLSKWVENHYLGVIKKRIITEEIHLFWKYLDYKRKYRPEESEIRKKISALLDAIRCIFFTIYKLNHTYTDIVEKLGNNERKLEQLKDEKWYINLYGAYSENRERIKKEWINEVVYVEFEGEKYPTIGKIDQYLSNLYGDYMVMPSENERINAHSEIFCEKEKIFGEKAIRRE